jgi:hypothetical protein
MDRHGPHQRAFLPRNVTRRRLIISMGALGGAIAISPVGALSHGLLGTKKLESQPVALAPYSLLLPSRADLIAFGATGVLLLSENNRDWGIWKANQYVVQPPGNGAPALGAVSISDLFDGPVTSSLDGYPSKEPFRRRLVILTGDIAKAKHLPSALAIAAAARQAGHVVVACPAAPTQITPEYDIGLRSLARAVECLIAGFSVNTPPEDRIDLEERLFYLNTDLEPLRIALTTGIEAAIAARFAKKPGIYELGRGSYNWPRSARLPTADELAASFFAQSSQWRRTGPAILSVTLSRHAPAKFQKQLFDEIFRAALPAHPLISVARETGFLSQYRLAASSLSRVE